MDMQELLNNAARAGRQKTLESSDQLTLGEMILKLEPIVKRQNDVIEKYKEEAKVRYDFGYLYPTCINSWRGIYSELALNYVSDEHSENEKELTVTAFLSLLKNSIGKTFIGYKGGDYVMHRHTPIWVANYGHSGNTAVIDIVDHEHTVIIITAYRES